MAKGTFLKQYPSKSSQLKSRKTYEVNYKTASEHQSPRKVTIYMIACHTANVNIQFKNLHDRGNNGMEIINNNKKLFSDWFFHSVNRFS